MTCARGSGNELFIRQGGGLTFCLQFPLSVALPAGRTAALVKGRGKSGLHGETVPGNARRGRPQGQCHREQTATPSETKRAVRVKGCGKSAPRDRQRERHGKPHREQNRIGMARVLSSGRVQALSALPSGLVARGVRQRASQMNDHHQCRVRQRYRTRLTDRLADSFQKNVSRWR